MALPKPSKSPVIVLNPVARSLTVGCVSINAVLNLTAALPAPASAENPFTTPPTTLPRILNPMLTTFRLLPNLTMAPAAPAPAAPPAAADPPLPPFWS